MMTIPGKIIFRRNFLSRLLVVAVCLSGMAVYTAAQKKIGNKSIFTKSTTIDMAPLAPPNLDQCANGALPGPRLDCKGSQWQNGNLNENNSQWVEGDVVPYRIIFTDLVPNSTGNTITIEYDTTEQGKHAIDFLARYNYTNTGAVPCEGYAFCANAPSTALIPNDPLVPDTFEFADADRLFTMWGATITNVSGPFIVGDYSGTSRTSYTITFTAGSTPNAVLAWGGHISTRIDWGTENSAIALPGSPYHMRIVGTGNQDRSMSVQGIIYPASLTIIKEVQTFNGGNSSVFPFYFTATNLGVPDFYLIDDNSQPADRYTTTNITSFGAANSITVTEHPVGGWSLADIVCVENPNGLPQLDNSSVNLDTETATIIVEEGEAITCTFRNVELQPTAADASISGRVLDASGQGIVGARLTLINASTGEMRSASTNNFGYYTITGLESSDFYTLTVNHRRYTFSNNTKSFTLNDNLTSMDFIGSY